MIRSVSLEARDHRTLVAAVRGLNVHVTITAARPWSRRADTRAPISAAELAASSTFPKLVGAIIAASGEKPRE